jgi:hypothetical protein
MRKRTKVILAGFAAAAVLGVSGFAFADFFRTTSAEASNEAVKFDSVTVSATADTQALLPGDSSSVTLAIGNPNTIKAKVIEIKPAAVNPVVVDPASIDVATDASYCEGLIDLLASSATPTINGGGSTVVIMNGAVTLDPAMDIRCEGMTFKTNWEVKFQAVRN